MSFFILSSNFKEKIPRGKFMLWNFSYKKTVKQVCSLSRRMRNIYIATDVLYGKLCYVSGKQRCKKCYLRKVFLYKER